MCTGRIDPAFILRGFRNGVDGVFIGGCWLGECHYITEGNHHAIVVMLLVQKMLRQLGIDPERLRLEWVSSSQGSRFAEVVTDFSNKLKELGPLGEPEGLSKETLMKRLEAAMSLVPYLKLVERERLRIKLKTREEYEEYFARPEVEKLYRETVGEQLALKLVQLLLTEKPLSTDDIAQAMDMSTAEATAYLSRARREGAVRFDEASRLYALPVAARGKE
jgi:coenzyme F420-reducing hydrogenase delta subunit